MSSLSAAKNHTSEFLFIYRPHEQKLFTQPLYTQLLCPGFLLKPHITFVGASFRRLILHLDLSALRQVIFFFQELSPHDVGHLEISVFDLFVCMVIEDFSLSTYRDHHISNHG